MMLSPTSTSMVRSSLEEMLDSLRLRDAVEKPKDLPPALPARPTSRGRLPSLRRSLPTEFKVNGKEDEKGNENGKNSNEIKGKDDGKRKEKELGPKMGSFGSKKMKKGHKEDSSPYFVPEEKCSQLQDLGSSNSTTDTSVKVMGKMMEPEWDDNITYFIQKKLHVWCRLPIGSWELGIIQSISGEEAFVSLPNGNVVKVGTGELFPANPDILEGVDDLIQLSYLNEPSVLNNLRFRYSRDMIYSKAGPLLIAVNPCKDVNVYGHDFITAYRDRVVDSPHVFAMSDTAYTAMMRDQVNQSIIISGESGAGKTETAKVAMQYLAALGGGGHGIECEILQTNVILEAFGNAKTSKNDNSSRFGKLIEIHFSSMGKICGANIQTFLLEKSRVAQLASGERSYHIFYQICAGAPSSLKERLNLKIASDYQYLNHSDCLAIDGVDDAQNFSKLTEALNIIQISKEDQDQLFAMLTSVLWLGNISFEVIDNENHVQVQTNEAVDSAARLLGCSMQELSLALSTHNIQAGKDSIAKRLTLQQAMDARDALAKFIYASLFDWLVGEINKSLKLEEQCSGRSISIVDIYGFESFKKNSFEQFCINYANERLQQHFNRHLLKLEQEEYELDGIDWTKVAFEDNQECLNLIEKKPIGLLSLLDEESNFPKATDMTFADKLKQHLHTNPCFKGERSSAFSIHHYAGEVLYETNGFLEKNRDQLHSDFIQLLSSCSSRLSQLFASKLPGHSQRMSNSSGHFSSTDTMMLSVGTKFKGQLFKLMNQLDNSAPHFVRCIRPNSKQLPGLYEEDLVLKQLRCCGVLEVVKISRSGYPTRVTHQEFSERYGLLLLETNVAREPLSISVAVLQQFNIHPEMYQVGYTKLFLRTGQIGVLEERRKQILRGIVGVQKRFRGSQDRRCFYELKNGAVALQSFIRGEKWRRDYNNISRKLAINAPQAVDVKLMAAIHLQSVIRGWLARKQFIKMRNFNKADLEYTKTKREQHRKISDVKSEQNVSRDIQALPSVLVELQRQVLKAEATIGQKDEENAALKEQLRQFETRWSEYEAKTKRMEEMWQRQMASLQMSLAAARKSLAGDDQTGQHGRHDPSTSPRCYDSEDVTSTGSRTPGGSTPIKFSGPISDIGPGRDSNGNFNLIGNLVKEFEQRRQNFNDDAKALTDARAPQSTSRVSFDEDLRKLKLRFETWKKEYKIRLRETKARLHRVGHAEDRSRRKWWGKISSRAS